MIDAKRDEYTAADGGQLESALGKLAEFIRSVDHLTKSLEYHDDAKALAVIMGTVAHARRLLSHLIRGYESLDVPLCAWAGRSLVELRVWNRYIWASEENRRRFYDDSILDDQDIQKTYLGFLEAIQVDGSSVSEIDGIKVELARIEKERTVSILKPGEKRLQVKVICKEVGLEWFYRVWFGLLSKASHPTPGLLVTTETGKEAVSADGVHPILVMGAQSAAEILNTTIDGLGIREGGLEKWVEIHKTRVGAANDPN